MSQRTENLEQARTKYFADADRFILEQHLPDLHAHQVEYRRRSPIHRKESTYVIATDRNHVARLNEEITKFQSVHPFPQPARRNLFIIAAHATLRGTRALLSSLAPEPQTSSTLIKTH